MEKLLTFFCDVIMMTSMKWCHIWFFKFNFVIIGLKTHNLSKSCNFRPPTSNFKGCWGRRVLTLGKFVTKTIHFRQVVKPWFNFRCRSALNVLKKDVKCHVRAKQSTCRGGPAWRDHKQDRSVLEWYDRATWEKNKYISFLFISYTYYIIEEEYIHTYRLQVI